MFSVLVVDDDDLVGRMVHRLLDREGHDIVVVTDAAQASRLERSFDVGVFDWHLPGPGGLALARELLASGRVRRAVFFTGGVSHESDLLPAAEIGPVLSKDARELRDLLRSWRDPKTSSA
jgi:two-component system, OmpR family, response regulator